MRCEGPIDGPCNRCQISHQDCIFDRPRQESKRKAVSRESFDAALERIHTLEHANHTLEYELQAMKNNIPRSDAQAKRMNGGLHSNAETSDIISSSNLPASGSVRENEPSSPLRSPTTLLQDTISPIFSPPTPIKNTSLPTFIANSFIPVSTTSSFLPSFGATNTSYPFIQQTNVRPIKSKSMSNLEDLRTVQDSELPPPLPLTSSKLWSKENAENTSTCGDIEMNNSPNLKSMQNSPQQSPQHLTNNHTSSTQASFETTMAEVMEAVRQNVDTMNVQRLLNARIYPAPTVNAIPSRTAPIMPPIQCEMYEQTTPYDSAVLFPPIYTSDGSNMLMNSITALQGEAINRQTLDCSRASPFTVHHRSEKLQVMNNSHFDHGNQTTPFSRPTSGYPQNFTSMSGNVSKMHPPVSLKDNLMMQPGTIITHQPFFHS